MLCTINTDASFHPKHKVGAYAFWSVSNSFKIQKAGYLQEFCIDSHDAEMKCIINAFYTVLNSGYKISKIIINTDSLNSIRVFENDKDAIKRWGLFKYKKHRKKFNEIRSKSSKALFFGLEIEFRHVKAHSNKKDARSYVNEWCDSNAKRFLWKRIHQLKLHK